MTDKMCENCPARFIPGFIIEGALIEDIDSFHYKVCSQSKKMIESCKNAQKWQKEYQLRQSMCENCWRDEADEDTDRENPNEQSKPATNEQILQEFHEKFNAEVKQSQKAREAFLISRNKARESWNSVTNYEESNLEKRLCKIEEIIGQDTYSLDERLDKIEDDIFELYLKITSHFDPQIEHLGKRIINRE